MKTLYVHRPLLNGSEVVKWATYNGLTTIAPEKMHITVAFSRTEVEWSQIPVSKIPVIGNLGVSRSVAILGPATVLKLKSDHCSARWQQFIDCGCSWDFPEYMPHIAISYTHQSIDRIKPFEGFLQFGPEVWDQLDLEAFHELPVTTEKVNQ